MNDLDDLRRALHAGVRHDPVDLPAIMTAGRRLRARRRLTAAAAAAAAAAVVVGLGVTVPRTSDRPAPAAPASAPASAPAPPGPPPDSSTPPAPAPAPVGKIIEAGIKYTDGTRRVFWFENLSGPGGATFGVMSGVRDAAGNLDPGMMANEPAPGRDLSPGFHAVSYDESGEPGPRSPAFGYFVGPVKRIVGDLDGTEVEAKLAPWSRNPKVTVFWFPANPPSAENRLDGIRAYDGDGNRL